MRLAGTRLWIALSALTLACLCVPGRGHAAAQDCSAGRFQHDVPYSHDESLPFDFSQPAAWTVQSMDSGQRWVTIQAPIGPGDAVTMSIDVVVATQPDRYPAMTEDVWKQTMDVVAKVPYAGQELLIFSQSWATTAKFLVPHGGRRYQVTINLANSERCPAEAGKLRDLVVHSLKPNPDTTFPGDSRPGGATR